MAKMNTVVGIAIAVTAKSFGVDAQVKWPNDVWVGKRKLAGILVNCDARYGGGVVGFGVNVNQDMRQAEPAVAAVATSLAAEAKSEVSREQVLAGICNQVERLMGLTYHQIMAEYAEYDMLVGNTVRVHHKTREIASPDDYDALVTGFTEEGYLMVRNTTMRW
jgi:BirA family transcriptional regulator, biotin operon repressor / biotin---[acetyl-CoA-carboxylase] ligase